MNELEAFPPPIHPSPIIPCQASSRDNKLWRSTYDTKETSWWLNHKKKEDLLDFLKHGWKIKMIIDCMTVFFLSCQMSLCVCRLLINCCFLSSALSRMSVTTKTLFIISLCKKYPLFLSLFWIGVHLSLFFIKTKWSKHTVWTSNWVLTTN